MQAGDALKRNLPGHDFQDYKVRDALAKNDKLYASASFLPASFLRTTEAPWLRPRL
jgi:hypothetical protein